MQVLTITIFIGNPIAIMSTLNSESSINDRKNSTQYSKNIYQIENSKNANQFGLNDKNNKINKELESFNDVYNLNRRSNREMKIFSGHFASTKPDIKPEKIFENKSNKNANIDVFNFG